MSIPVYSWFDQAPEGHKTRRQLAELGLRPGGPVVGRVVWKRGKRWADLYDQAAAVTKKPATPAQLEALKKARHWCVVCQQTHEWVVTVRTVRNCAEYWEHHAERGAELADVRDQARAWLADSLILDSETTDLDGYLVQLAILDTGGGVLLDTLINPEAPISEGARRIHGLGPAELAGAPTFAELADQVRQLLDGRRVIIYNAAFDTGILHNEFARLAGDDSERYHELGRWLRSGVSWRCAMELYAAWVGDWSEYHGNYRWQPLPGGDHTAAGDCRATLALLRQLAEEPTE